MAVTVSVRDARASESDRRWIQGVYRDYLDDLAPDTGVFPVLGEVGHREPDQILRWFGDPNAFPLIILKAAEPVGFAMVARPAPSATKPRIDYRMAEFFIARTRRRLGIGQGEGAARAAPRRGLRRRNRRTVGSIDAHD